MATASWTKSVDDINLIGILTILEVAENTWSMKFRIVRAGVGGSTAPVARDAVIELGN